ncbi:MAG: UvrD-helicase domain-containing protein [Thermoleophilaceae bacterium]
MSTTAAADQLLEGLNEPQRAAVLHGEGPLLILAGAGSGKTRVLTHRIAYLVQTGRAHPGEILAITFTNKAAGEMRERVEQLVGGQARRMWVMTFHSACARMLRAHAERLGYKRAFTIYDEDDSLRLVKRCVEELDVDPKRFTPRAIKRQISDAKNDLKDPDGYREGIGSFFEQTVADVYALYERRMLEMNAMDFDDLLVRCVNVLELFPEVRAGYQSTFKHVLVDEYQDTNRAQYRLLQLIAGEHRNLCVVGDDDQCLMAGTLVTMGDGSVVPIESVREGDEVLSVLAPGQFGPSRVLRVHAARATDGIAVRMESGRMLVSTPEHMHFAAGCTDLGAIPTESVQSTSNTAVLEAIGARTGLPLIVAVDVRPGMAMLGEQGEYDRVQSAQRIALNATVHDLDIAETHNFIANGIVTHNSIYSFRGADIRNILDFEDDFETATVVKLEQNYRSTQTILDAANAVIANNRGRKEKALWSELGRGEPVHLRELEDEFAEARFVVGEIERRVDEGESRDEMAVFYRTNAQSRVLEEVLVRYDVGYQVIGGRKFYERKEIRDGLAYLTFLVNPSDAIAFQRIAGSPRRGIGDTTQQRIVGHANTIGEQVWEIAARPDLVPGLGAAAVKAVGRFMSVMERLRERAEGGAAVGDLLEETLHEVGYIEALQAERTIEAEGRLENLEQLVEGAREYHETEEEPSVDGYLESISLRADTDELTDDAGIVTLMTLHSAKGLEYPVVFVIGCEDGVFPSSRAIEAGDLEEERRLCYVGLTRAQRELHLTYARTRARHGAREWNAPSRFLAEVPPELTDAEEHLAPARVSATSWGSPAPAASRPEPRPSGAAFAIGDDVLHAKFGEGVVTGKEPGGIVIVRFPAEGEKKLMEDYAPLKKVS